MWGINARRHLESRSPYLKSGALTTRPIGTKTYCLSLIWSISINYWLEVKVKLSARNYNAHTEQEESTQR